MYTRLHHIYIHVTIHYFVYRFILLRITVESNYYFLYLFYILQDHTNKKQIAYIICMFGMKSIHKRYSILMEIINAFFRKVFKFFRVP